MSPFEAAIAERRKREEAAGPSPAKSGSGSSEYETDSDEEEESDEDESEESEESEESPVKAAPTQSNDDRLSRFRSRLQASAQSTAKPSKRYESDDEVSD